MGGNVELSKLSGSEKQIAWAEEIRSTVLHIMDRALEFGRSLPDSNPYKHRNIQYINDHRKLVASAEYAGDIINLFKDIRETDNLDEDLSNLLAVYHIHHGITTGEQRILMR